MIGLIPFDICSIDSSFTVKDGGSVGQETSSKLIDNIVAFCSECLADTGSPREMASFCLSSILTRPDMENRTLASFLDWSKSKIKIWSSRAVAVESDLSTSLFEIIGVLRCLGQIFKSGHRFKVLDYGTEVLDLVLSLSQQSNQVIVRKLSMKLVQRLGMM